MNRLFVTFGCWLMLVAPVSAVNVAWVSFHGADDAGNTPSTPAAGVGFTVAPDKGYTDLLITAGYTINRITAPLPAANAAIPAALLAELNAADLVIIGRSVNSGTFEQAAETVSWNADVTVPMLITSGYIIRDNRLAYTTGNTIPDINAPTRLLANNPTHPVFNGITLDTNNETAAVLEIVTSPVNGAAQRGTSINSNPIIPGGTLIATVTTDNPVTDARGGAVIAEWPAGTPGGNAGETMGSKRMLFITGSREVDGVTGDSAGILDLTPLGRQLFLNAVAYIGGPSVPLVPGDTDGDGVVELEDFNPIRDNFRKTVTMRTEGDLVPNGKVDFADFRQWKGAFVAGGGSLAGLDLSVAANVPEPSSILLAAVALLSVAGLSRRVL